MRPVCPRREWLDFSDLSVPRAAGLVEQWPLTKSRKSAVMPISEVAPFTWSARSAESVVLRVTDRDGDTVTETFMLDGFADALQTIPCGY